MPDTVRTGRCLCRAVTFAARGEPRWVAHCHCESCRARADVAWTGGPLGAFQSSPGVMRRFCRACGSPMSFEGEAWPDEIHLFVASFDAPETLAPTAHVHVGEQLRWLHVTDGLPRFSKTSGDGPAV
jgi:hypothetical protein